jgi:hypothetical protein
VQLDTGWLLLCLMPAHLHKPEEAHKQGWVADRSHAAVQEARDKLLRPRVPGTKAVLFHKAGKAGLYVIDVMLNTNV